MGKVHRKQAVKKNRSQAERKLQLESLEQRMLLAGDTYLINFQNDEATIPTGYQRDTGDVLGLRGNGLSYGWSSDHTDQARERSAEADQRLDTLIHFEVGQQWEFQLANGNYEVMVGVGDPGNNDGIHTINVEGVNYWNAVADTNVALMETRQVTVADGRLTVDAGAAANKETRLDFLHIVGLPSGPNTAPVTPTVTEPAVDGQQVSPADPHLEAVDFFDSDGDLHQSSDWEIWTVGAGAEPVWQTLGIQGVERLHTHLGDGIFLNARAGETSLGGNTDYQLRVRFRDDAGSVSAYGTRQFSSGAASTVFSLEIEDVATAPVPTWEALTGGAVDLPAALSIVSPGDTIIAIDTDIGDSSYPGGEEPQKAVDGTLDKYLNFGEVNSGFIVTPSITATIVESFQITTANNAPERDPTTWQLSGTNEAVTSADNSTGSEENWILIDSGNMSLPSARNKLGPNVAVGGSTAYTSYRMIFTGVKDSGAANSMQIAEIEFFGDSLTLPTPASLRVESAEAELLLSLEGTDVNGNLITNPAALASHADLRVVVSGGSSGLGLGSTDLTFTDGDGQQQTIFLPSLSLSAGEDAYFWVAIDGSTYFGQPGQTVPDFSFVARRANLDVPFISTQAGFIVEEVSSDYRLPVNIAFVPDPGPNLDDPLYFVTELYGSIQVVTRAGTKHEFATGLLDYNPQGPISGSGEQGLSGIAVERDAADPEIYHLYVGMLWDNGAPAGGATHYPKVERLDSVSGGLSIDTRTVLLNMQPETQGQSHQISNITVGPDGMLYVHNGDGFDASTARDLDQFRGKVLRMNLDGSPAIDNPFYDAGNGINARDYVFAYGLRNPFGGAWRASDGKHYSVENGPSVDRMAQINAGVNYGWNGTNLSMFTGAIYNWSPAHAPVNITFLQQETFDGSLFPADKLDHAFVSESGPTYAEGAQTRGKRIVEFEFDASGDVVGGPTTLVEYAGLGHSSIVGIAAGPDGLYFTELYEDSGENGPTAAGARIFRVSYVGGITADFDIDNDVDGADLTRWEGGFGTPTMATVAAGDADADGDVDGADFFSWQRNYTGPQTSSASIGESQTQSVVSTASNLAATPNASVAEPLVVAQSFGATSANLVTESSARFVAAADARLRSIYRRSTHDHVWARFGYHATDIEQAGNRILPREGGNQSKVVDDRLIRSKAIDYFGQDDLNDNSGEGIVDSLAGDEDNGEMSAWYVSAAMGQFPLCPGSGQMVKAPCSVFDRVSWETSDATRRRVGASSDALQPKAPAGKTTQSPNDRFTY